jgi:hypothetical protein
VTITEIMGGHHTTTVLWQIHHKAVMSIATPNEKRGKRGQARSTCIIFELFWAVFLEISMVALIFCRQRGGAERQQISAVFK